MRVVRSANAAATSTAPAAAGETVARMPLPNAPKRAARDGHRLRRAARADREEHAEPHERDGRGDRPEAIRDGREREERRRSDDEGELLHD